MRKNTFVFRPMILALSVVLAACGGGGDDAPKTGLGAPSATTGPASNPGAGSAPGAAPQQSATGPGAAQQPATNPGAGGVPQQPATGPSAGGVPQQPAPVAREAVMRVPVGLQNANNADCFINAALQLIRVNPDMRKLAEAKSSTFTAFFKAYDANASQQDLRALHVEVLKFVRSQLPELAAVNESNQALQRDGKTVKQDRTTRWGSLDEVFDLLSIPVDLNFGGSLGNIINLYGNGSRVFDLANTDKAENNAFAALESVNADKLVGFSYTTPNHKYAYIRHGKDWYKVNDASVTKVSYQDLMKLKNRSINSGSGIEFAVYRS